jgi:hypothetical protein
VWCSCVIEETVIAGIIVAVVSAAILDAKKRGEVQQAFRGLFGWIIKKTKELAEFLVELLEKLKS